MLADTTEAALTGCKDVAAIALLDEAVEQLVMRVNQGLNSFKTSKVALDMLENRITRWDHDYKVETVRILSVLDLVVGYRLVRKTCRVQVVVSYYIGELFVASLFHLTSWW